MEIDVGIIHNTLPHLFVVFFHMVLLWQPTLEATCDLYENQVAIVLLEGRPFCVGASETSFVRYVISGLLMYCKNFLIIIIRKSQK